MRRSTRRVGFGRVPWCRTSAVQAQSLFSVGVCTRVKAVGAPRWSKLLPDVLVAVALFLALVVSSFAVVDVVADFVVDRAEESVQVVEAWNRSQASACCAVLVGELGSCWC